MNRTNFPFKYCSVQTAIIVLLLSFFAVSANAQELNFQPMYFMISTEKIDNADLWQKDFGNRAGKIDRHGLMPIGTATDVANSNAIVTGYVIADFEKAKQYIQSGLFKADRQDAGVSVVPITRFFYCLDAIDDNSGNKNIFTITHQVKNYNLWKQKLFADEKEWLKAGVKYVGIVHTIENPTEISVIFTYHDINLAKEYVSSGYKKNVLTSSGIDETPSVQYLQLNSDQPDQNNNEQKTAYNSADKLTLRLTTNADCDYIISTGETGSLFTGSIIKIQLPKGSYSFLFSSVSNPVDSVRINYKVDKTNSESVLFADVQGAIHKRISKEHSPRDTSSADEYDMVFVKGGTFTMGNDSLTIEMKTHNVTVNDFYISKYELTQKQWKEIMGNNPSHFQGCDNCPVENVSWNDAVEFIAKLNSEKGTKFRLPTEAEWEYAAKGGSESKHYIYSGSSDINEVGWNGANSCNEPHPVGQLKPNELGLYDMTGNVIEWCSDWFSPITVIIDGLAYKPFGDSANLVKNLRGGSWSHEHQEALPDYRFKDEPSNTGRRTGFRLAADK